MDVPVPEPKAVPVVVVPLVLPPPRGGGGRDRASGGGERVTRAADVPVEVTDPFAVGETSGEFPSSLCGRIPIPSP